ncbi:MAG: type II toxin-antitoxin system Phd/YefM family antitoxin [Fimbriiglobus sp.]
MHIVNITEAKKDLATLVKRVLAGDDIVIARHGKPLVRLSPYRPAPNSRTGL